MLDATHRDTRLQPAPRPLVLFGVGAAQGVGRGPVHVVRSRDELGRLRPDEVLVVDALPTRWMPAMPACRAVVAQVGGLLAFSARALRERGIPAVVGALGALDELRDGDLVEVDGYSGIVRLVG